MALLEMIKTKMDEDSEERKRVEKCFKEVYPMHSICNGLSLEKLIQMRFNASSVEDLLNWAKQIKSKKLEDAITEYFSICHN